MNFTGKLCELSTLSNELGKFKLNDNLFACLFTLCILNGVLAAVAIFSNTLVVATLLKHRELQSNSNVLILFLALTDLMVGLVVQPSFIVFIAGKLYLQFNCEAMVSYLFTEIFGVGLSLLTLSVVTLERYIAIFHPFWYISNVTKAKLFASTALVWAAWATFNVVCRALKVKNDEFFTPIGSVIIGSALIFNTVVYCKVFRVVRRHEREIASLQKIGASVKTRKRNSGDSAIKEQQLLQMETNEEDSQMTRTVGYILGTLILCYFPLMATSMIEMMTSKDEIFDHCIYPMVETIMFMNSALNPFLYCWRCRDIRKKILEMVQNAKEAEALRLFRFCNNKNKVSPETAPAEA